MSFENQVALITGATSRIGYACAKYLLQNGVKVALCDINLENCQSAATELFNVFGAGRTLAVQCDVTDQDNLENAFKTCISNFKRLDIVINNPGAAVIDESHEVINWERVTNMNYEIVVRGTLLAIKYMGAPCGGNGGVIVQIAHDAASYEYSSFNPTYRPDNVGKAIIHILKRGRTGEFWIMENEETPKRVIIPPDII